MRALARILSPVIILAMVLAAVAAVFPPVGVVAGEGDGPAVDPLVVDLTMAPGHTQEIVKSITVPSLPDEEVAGIQVLLLQDETGSYGSYVDTLKTKAPEIFDAISDMVPNAEFGVAGFQDFPVDPWGLVSDLPYRLIQDFTSDRATFVAGVNQLDAPSGAGADGPESQYEALYEAARGLGNDPYVAAGQNPTWSDDPDVIKVILLATDVDFHTPDTTAGYPGPTRDTVVNALIDDDIIVAGIEPYEIAQLHDVADATGGTVVNVSMSGEGVADAIVDAVGAAAPQWALLQPVVNNETPLQVVLDPPELTDVVGGSTVEMTEIVHAPIPMPAGFYSFTVAFTAYENVTEAGLPLGEGELVGTQTVNVQVLNVPPEVCPVEVLTNLTVPEIPLIRWNYFDGNADPQLKYEVEVWTGPGGYGECMWNPQVFAGTAQEVLYDGKPLDVNSYYFARVRASDAEAGWGPWCESEFCWPHIDASPYGFYYGDVFSGEPPIQDSVQVYNWGCSDLKIDFYSDVDWINFGDEVTSATVPPDSFFDIFFEVDVSMLEPGTWYDPMWYSGNILIDSNDPNPYASTVMIPVELGVWTWYYVEPTEVYGELYPGQRIEIDKLVRFDELPVLDVYYLVDDTESFAPFLDDFRQKAMDTSWNIEEMFPGSRFGLGAFRDYPVAPWGTPGVDFAYNNLCNLTDSSTFAGWLSELTGEGAGDAPESQYQALYEASTSTDIGWRADSYKAVVLVTNSGFHNCSNISSPSDEYPGACAEDAIDALNEAGISVFGPMINNVEQVAEVVAETGGVTWPQYTDAWEISQKLYNNLGILSYETEALLMGSTVAEGEMIFGVDPWSDALWSINPTTYAADEIGLLNPTGLYDGVESMALAPDGTVYVWNNEFTGVSGGLLTVDLATGQATPVGTPIRQEIISMAYNASEDIIYACTGNAELVRIDPATGSVSFVNEIYSPTLGMLEIVGMDYDADGQLWGVSFQDASGYSYIVTIDVDDYLVTVGSGEPLVDVGIVGSIVFDPESELFIGSATDGTSGQMFYFDAYGDTYNVGAYASDEVPQGMAILPGTPPGPGPDPYMDWVDIGPGSWDWDQYTNRSVSFSEHIKVPLGTGPGMHSFVVKYSVGGVYVGDQLVEIEVLPTVEPLDLEATMLAGDCCDFYKSLYVPALEGIGTGAVDVVLLEDETGSFYDDIDYLQSMAPGLFDAIREMIPDSRFGVAGFRDYPIGEFGDPGDWPFRLLQDLTFDRNEFVNAVNVLSAYGGYDGPEAQWDALLESALNFSWREGAMRVIIIATDASFHECGDVDWYGNRYPGPCSANVIQMLIDAGITVIGIESGYIQDVHDVADATGGVVEQVSSSGEGIVEAILSGLGSVVASWESVYPVAVDADPIQVSFDPEAYYDVTGPDWLYFGETICVPEGTPAGTYEFTVEFYGVDASGEEVLLGTQYVTIEVIEELDWVVMVYLDGDNPVYGDGYCADSSGYFGGIDEVLSQIECAHCCAGVRPVILVDRWEEYYPMSGDWWGQDSVILEKACCQLRPVDDGGAVIPAKGDVNMGDPETLANFINWVRETYPSQNYALIMADQGQGWRGCHFMRDVTNDDSLTIPELGEGLAGGTMSGEWPLDLIAFDAGFMQMLEVDAQIADYADYVVGSEEWMPPFSLPYYEILSQLCEFPVMAAEKAARDAFVASIEASVEESGLEAADAAFMAELEENWPWALAAAEAAYDAVIAAGGTVAEADAAFDAELIRNWPEAWEAAKGAYLAYLAANYEEEYEDAMAAADAAAAAAPKVMTPEQLGILICDAYAQRWGGYFDGHYMEGFPWYTMSLKDLSVISGGEIEGLIGKVNDLAGQLLSGVGKYDEALAKARQMAETFGRFDMPYGGYTAADGWMPEPGPLAFPNGHIDLGNFANITANLLSETSIGEAAAEVVDWVQSAVIYEVHGDLNPGATGIAIYYPDVEMFGDGMQAVVYETCYDTSSDFAMDSQWAAYLKAAPRLVEPGLLAMYIPDALLLAHVHEDPIIRFGDYTGGASLPEGFTTVGQPVDIHVSPEGAIDIGVLLMMYSRADLRAAGVLDSQLIGIGDLNTGAEQWRLEELTMVLPSWLLDLGEIMGPIVDSLGEAGAEVAAAVEGLDILGGGLMADGCSQCNDYIGAVLAIPWLDLSNLAPGVYKELPDLPRVSSDLEESYAIVATERAEALTSIQYPQNLYEGWNLVSLPVIPVDSDIETVLSGSNGLVDSAIESVDVVWQYDAVAGEWLAYPADVPEVGDLTEMKDGVGYWVNMLEDATLTVVGSNMLAGPNAPPEYDLVPGWNLIGYKGILPMPPMESWWYEEWYDEWEDNWYYEEWYIGGYLESDKVEWNRLQGYHRVWDTQITVDFMQPNEGYWVYIPEGGEGSIPGLNDEAWVEVLQTPLGEYWIEAAVDWIGYWMLEDAELGLRLAWNAGWYVAWVLAPNMMDMGLPYGLLGF